MCVAIIKPTSFAEEGSVRSGYDRLAEETGLARKTVIGAVKRLKPWLEIQAGGGRGRTNLYRARNAKGLPHNILSTEKESPERSRNSVVDTPEQTRGKQARSTYRVIQEPEALVARVRRRWKASPREAAKAVSRLDTIAVRLEVEEAHIRAVVEDETFAANILDGKVRPSEEVLEEELRAKLDADPVRREEARARRIADQWARAQERLVERFGQDRAAVAIRAALEHDYQPGQLLALDDVALDEHVGILVRGQG